MDNINEQEKRDLLSSEQVLELLADLLNSSVCASPKGNYVEERIPTPINLEGEIWQYKADGKTLRAVRKGSRLAADFSLPEFLWSRLRLERVCERYLEAYQEWEADNNGIPYLSTTVVGDDGETKWERPFSFMDDFLSNHTGGLHLLMAEFGMGKTSFCYGLRKRVAGPFDCKEPVIKEQFLSDEAAFPFIFNLNDFRDQDFDQFIQNRLLEEYGISLRFRTFERLCRAGLFTVVLDAWDQMHGTPRPQQVIRDISQFSSLWEEKGQVLITCRRSFYQTQLHASDGGHFGRESMQQAKLYTLCGFRKLDARRYLNMIYEVAPSKLLSPNSWFDKAWEMNAEFFSRPLNVQLLAKYFDEFRKSYHPETESIDTRDLLEVVLRHWEDGAENDEKAIPKDLLLKQLTTLTLKSGLNRGIRLQYLANSLGENSRPQVERQLERLEFVAIRRDKSDAIGDIVEFRLAAYQEFLWAHLVLQELGKKRLCKTDTLISQFLLNPETRTWVAKTLQNEESDILLAQLNLLAYKNAGETGYSGGNTLTILGDLNRIEFYKNQLREARLTDRPLQGADLHGLDLSGLAFRRSNLREANFSYTRLNKADFSLADLTDACWDEYGKLRHCAILTESSDDGKQEAFVVSGTETGGVLTFNLVTNNEQMMRLNQDEIRDIAADSEGVYTAGRDGYVGYIGQHGELKNAYIAAGGIQSITTGAPGAVYVGVDSEGLTRYDWKRGSRCTISVTDLKGDSKEISNAYDIHYYENCGEENHDEQYIAYTSDNQKTLTLLALEGRDCAQELGHGVLQGELFFSDICFAGEYLVYAVPGRGIFATEIASFFGELNANALCSKTALLCELDTYDPVELAWAKKPERILAVIKGGHTVSSLLSLPYGEGNSSTADGQKQVDLDWVFDFKNYAIKGNQIDGFCVSDDGAYVALAGERLAVFSREEEINYYALVQPPIEAKIECSDAVFQGCDGIPPKILNQFRDRGAKI